jgi:hypothetical protein
LQADRPDLQGGSPPMAGLLARRTSRNDTGVTLHQPQIFFHHFKIF